ncbi:hypothetical protein Pcac1_g5544 [Phytophthora cactorum]|nr:hypothetical protein Pcac1_g5544 [Phytophthora cactorum]
MAESDAAMVAPVAASTDSASPEDRTLACSTRRPTAPAAMASPSPPPKRAKAAEKRPVVATSTIKAKKPTKPKKRTKKQIAEDADKRRKELAALSNRLMETRLFHLEKPF